MAEAVGSSSSCAPFSGDARSLFATLSGVVTVFMTFLAQAADLMNGPLFELLVGEPTGYFGKIVMAVVVPGIGAVTAFSSSVNTWKTSWKLKRDEFWQGQRLKASRGSNDSQLYWDPRTLKALMVAQIWIAYSGEAEIPENAGNNGSRNEAVVSNPINAQQEEAIKGIWNFFGLRVKIQFEESEMKNDIFSSPLPQIWPKEDNKSKPKSLKDVEATHPLKIQGKEMLCYKLSALSIKDGGSSHAGGADNLNEQEHHIIPVSECNTNHNDISNELPPGKPVDEDPQLQQLVMFLYPIDKQALLQLGFVPDYEELSYLRTNTSGG